jgi:hypothetical protein
LVRIDSVEGMISAPPMPMSARVAINASEDPAKADITDPMPKMTRPRESALRRP